MVRQYQIEALVLKLDNSGEADNRLTVLARKYGKITVMAKGIRKISSRRAPYLDLFNHSRMYLSRGRSFDIVTEVTLINNFSRMRKNLDRVACVFKMSELMLRLLPEGEIQDNVFFRVLDDIGKLDALKTPVDDKKLVHMFSVFLLKNLGFIPVDAIVPGENLDRLLEDVMEKKIRTNSLLSKLVK